MTHTMRKGLTAVGVMMVCVAAVGLAAALTVKGMPPEWIGVLLIGLLIGCGMVFAGE